MQTFVKSQVKEARVESSKKVIINYTNWKGLRGDRMVTPIAIHFDSTEYHPERQWILLAYDHAKDADRAFAIKDIHSWGVADV